jgi:UDP-N-acetylglucosamine diphosphorylase/glucosamine-1-phosphate N-acetyltransferase
LSANDVNPATLWLLEPEDRTVWAPFSLTRTLGELLFGTLTLRARIEGTTGLAVTGVLVSSGLGSSGLGSSALGSSAPEPDPSTSGRLGSGPEPTPPVPAATFPPGPPRVSGLGDRVPGIRIALLSTLVPEPTPAWNLGAQTWRAVTELRTPDGTVVGWVRPEGTPLDAPPTAVRELPGFVLESPWALMARNAAQITVDCSLGMASGTRPIGGGGVDAGVPRAPDARTSFANVHVLGDHPVTADPGVDIDPFVVLDAREGPIHLCEGVRLDPFTRLVGPVWVGPRSRILGGTVAHATIGPVCRIRGEVEASVIQGWSNKAHDGYLGHAVVGSFVNLGAFTTNSDLKNTYGPVRAPLGPAPGDPTRMRTLETGLIKAGVLLGDHVKTGIGTLLGTGTVVGAGSNLFGGVLPPTWVPPFSWGTGSELEPFRLDRFLEITERAMSRRDIPLSRELRDALALAWHSAPAHGTPTHGAG